MSKFEDIIVGQTEMISYDSIIRFEEMNLDGKLKTLFYMLQAILRKLPKDDEKGESI